MSILLIGGTIIPNGLENFDDIINQANLKATKEKGLMNKYKKRDEIVKEKIHSYFVFWINHLTNVNKKFLKDFDSVFYNKEILEINDDGYFLIQ